MRKHLLLFTQLFLTLSVFAQTYKYTSTNLNLRSGPSASYQVLATIPVGTSVEMAESCDCSWIKIYYNGKIGYVSSKYLITSQQFVNKQTSNTISYQRNTSSNVKYYTNSSGQRVQSPTYYNSAPAGATALCRDGTYSFSKNRQGTCSRHGGVAKWLK